MSVGDLPPMQFLAAFEAAGRTGSIKAAAAELHLTSSAISQQIKALEDALHVSLFERRGRAIVLTREGETYLQDVRRVLFDVSNATRRVRRIASGQVLNVSSIDFVAYEFVLPRLASLRKRFPGLELRFESSSDVVDVEASEFDCALRVGGGPWPELVTHGIGKLTTAVVSSPGLAERLRRKGDLFQSTLIEQRGQEHRGWHAYLKANGKATESASFLMLHTYLEIMLAAEQGLGAAFGLFPLTTRWVELGRLAVPYPVRVPLPGELCLLHHPAHRERELLRELAEWLREEYAQLSALPEGRIVR